MFIDTSVIVAILANEPDARDFAEKIERDGGVTSALVIVEATMRLSSKLGLHPVAIETRIQALLKEARVDVMSMDRGLAALAVQAFASYGKGRGHPAQLNMADCLSYACAKAQGVRLLYKGGDFARTDLA